MSNIVFNWGRAERKPEYEQMLLDKITVHPAAVLATVNKADLA